MECMSDQICHNEEMFTQNGEMTATRSSGEEQEIWNKEWQGQGSTVW